MPSEPPNFRRLPAFAVIFIIFALGLAACEGGDVKGQGGPGASGGGKGRAGGPGGAARAVVVTASPVLKKAVLRQIDNLIGTVEPVASVTIKARVGGELKKVHFTEGQDVKQNELLFTIDPGPFQATLRQVEANLTRDQAQAANAANDLKRYQDLSKRGAVSSSDYDKIQTNFAALQATVHADQASVENARLQLGYTEIRSPITGRTGSLGVDAGNLVKADDSSLVTINQISPIYVNFAVDESRLAEVKRSQAGRPLEVTVSIDNDTGAPIQGTLTFIDNAVTAGSGRITMRGTFPNTDRRLWPGLFVHATLTLETQADALVIPAVAIQTGQNGTFVYVIKPDLTVESRPVTIDRQVGSDMVLASGLAAGEQVVTDGQLQLVPKAKVEIKQAGGIEKPEKKGASEVGKTATTLPHSKALRADKGAATQAREKTVR